MLNKFEQKVLTFATALQSVYREEEEREDIPKMELIEGELTEDFTAMLFGVFIFYKQLTGDDVDFTGFTHACNRLVIQHCMEEKE